MARWGHGTFVYEKRYCFFTFSHQDTRPYGTFRWKLVLYDLPLVVLHTKSIISYHLWCMLRDSVWIWMKSNLFLVHWGPNSLGALGIRKWLWPSMIRYGMFFIWTSTLTTSKHALKHAEHGRCCIHNNQLLTRSRIELEDNFNVPFYWPNFCVP